MHATPGYSAEKQQVIARLKRIEGQVRGLQHCVAGAAASGDTDRTTELVHEATKAVERLLRA